jgi:ribosome-associated heat shock protein Hsp15
MSVRHAVPDLAEMRLDKWLWCARFFKTRALAAEAVKAGRVQVGGQPVKPARCVRAGDPVQLRQGAFTFRITVRQLSANRLPATAAAQLYEEAPDSVAARAQLAAQIRAEGKLYPRAAGRPTKRDRRSLMNFKRREPG